MANISKIKLPNISEVLNIKDTTARQMIENLPTPMQFKGALGVGGTYTKATFPAAATANTGWTLKVITEDIYQGVEAKVGDTLISNGSEWVCIPSGDEPSGTVTNVATGAELTGGPIASNGTISHVTSGVTAGTVQGITVNAYGHVTAIQDMGYITSAASQSADFNFAANSATQTISVSGVTADTIGIVAVSQNATQAQYQAAAKAQLRCTSQSNGTITMTAYGTTPTVAIPCVLTIFK